MAVRTQQPAVRQLREPLPRCRPLVVINRCRSLRLKSPNTVLSLQELPKALQGSPEGPAAQPQAVAQAVRLQSRARLPLCPGASRRAGSQVPNKMRMGCAADRNEGGLPQRKGQRQACPASETRCDGSIPILASALWYLLALLGEKMMSGSGGQCSQPFAWISLSSWPGDHPA